MQQTWEYIEAYFTQSLGDEERKAFEVRCEQDVAFARDVAFYLTARSAARELLMDKKQKKFAADGAAKTERREIAAGKRMAFRKWMFYAAACIILFIGS